MTQAELEKLEAILVKMHNAVGAQDVDAEAVIDAEFHVTLAIASHNRMLDQFYASVITMLRDHIASNTYDATVNNIHAGDQSMKRLIQHESIYLAIRNRNSDDAQQAMFAHIDFVGKQFEPGLSG
jgi:GntR family transcriptional repressor for pyruvate dehydrogenase complex